MLVRYHYSEISHGEFRSRGWVGRTMNRRWHPEIGEAVRGLARETVRVGLERPRDRLVPARDLCAQLRPALVVPSPPWVVGRNESPAAQMNDAMCCRRTIQLAASPMPPR
ncbi:hypothetical protein VTK73DRAFT_5932 [Phialemonium thermophilum]|uniref:Uncharacterized protein n=1 Tax=Phialemonium thermophilum TaxID=223376 RepID=A0ABR3V0X3_9PEZI